MKQLNPYISFSGNCREAMSFYKDCFGGELQIMTIGESPMCDQMPNSTNKDGVMHASLEGGNFVLMGTDMGDAGDSGQKISIAIAWEKEEEINKTFTSLSTGGSVFCPLGPAFWGGLFGVTTDKYGVTWMMTCDNGQSA